MLNLIVLLGAAQISTMNCIPDANGGAMCTTMNQQTGGLSSTNCMPDAVGGAMCTTTNMSLPGTRSNNSSPKPSYSGTGNAIFDLFDLGGNRRTRKTVGKLLADGDCPGAWKYALIQGDMGLADQVHAICKQDVWGKPK